MIELDSKRKQINKKWVIEWGAESLMASLGENRKEEKA